MIPPSFPMVVFALFIPADVADPFSTGIAPRLVIGVFLLFASDFLALMPGFAAHLWQGMGRLLRAFRSSFWALIMPVPVIAGMVTGVATVIEIGVLAALYAMIVSLIICRDAARRNLLAALVSARIPIIIAASGAFVWISARVGLSLELAAVVTDLSVNPTQLMALIAMMLLLLGTVLEPASWLVVIAPVIAPVAILAGIDVIQPGIVFGLASAIDLVTPPVGILLCVTSSQANVPLTLVLRESLIFLLALLFLPGAVVLWHFGVGSLPCNLNNRPQAMRPQNPQRLRR